LQLASREQREVREENLRGHFDNKKAPTTTPIKKELPANEAAKGNGGIVDSSQPSQESQVKEGELGKDPQLDRALQLLKNWGTFKTTVAAAKTANGAGAQ
ncbi:MAG TPA: hypothetical protein VNN62_20200, partial [Methylomirabilota bacterium]|nr:hypothetical protein [Methylomirabilota bacterium]